MEVTSIATQCEFNCSTNPDWLSNAGISESVVKVHVICETECDLQGSSGIFC